MNSTTKPGSQWVINRWCDAALLIWAPLLIAPIFLLLQSFVANETLILFVAAFGQLGHNLPGMIRAYGDPQLFHRYRTRFVFVPLVLVAVCILAMHYDLQGLILTAAVWGIWHAMMQTYGFLRIYDGKGQAASRNERKWDFLICVAWFGLPVLFSSPRMAMLLDYLYGSGVPALPAALFAGLRNGWLLLTIVVTVSYVGLQGWRWLRGEKLNYLKLCLLVSSLGFFAFTHLAIRNVLVGLAMFEVFHDIQYLAIVWVFNVKRVEKSGEKSGPLRYLFRRSGALLGVYLGCVFAYGSLRFLENGLVAGWWRDTLSGLLAASGLLHFYYDGFIWKLRDEKTRQPLSISSAPSNSEGGPAPPWHAGLAHVAKWCCLIVPVGWLFLAQDKASSEAARLVATAETLPAYAPAQTAAGFALQSSGHTQKAMSYYRRALKLDDNEQDARINLSVSLRHLGRHREALFLLQPALAKNPRQVGLLVNLANTYAAMNQGSRAETYYRRALELDRKHIEALNNLGILLARQKNWAAAETFFRRALAVNPNQETSHFNLGNVLTRQGRTQDAIVHYRRALELRPDYSRASRKLRQALARKQ